MESFEDLSKALPFYDKPLPDNHIRLLELEHEEGEPLRCRLTAVDSATKPLYNALSYTWGDPRPEISQEPGFDDMKHNVYVNGHKTTVGTNLYNVLLRSRSGCPTTHIPFWVDALCINQMDPVEKAIQVENMDQVYKNANTVFAWLGEADDYTIAGFAAIERLATMSKELHPDYTSHRLRKLSDYGFDEWDWTSLLAVFHRAWFSRVWVIQEVYFARRIAVLYGDRILSGEIFGHAVKYLLRAALWQKLLPYRMMFTTRENRHAGGPGIQALGSVMWALQQRDAPPEDRILHPKVITTFGRGSKATDLRDHVYALRGLAKEAISLSGTTELELPNVNYEDSVTVDDAFLGWMKFMIEEVENYLLFSMVEDSSHRAVRSLPSWVPDLSVSMMPNALRFVDDSSSWKPFGANTDGWILHTDDLRTIKVPAAHFDSIMAVSKDFDSFNGTQDYVSILEFIEPLTAATSLFASILGTAATFPYSNPLEALARVMTADSSTPADQSQSLALNLLCWLATRIVSITGNAQAMFAPLLRMATRNYAVRQTIGRLSAELNNTRRMDEVQAFEVRSNGLRNCRRFVRTRRNYVGIAGVSAAVGDQIWILPNSRIPFVVRKKMNGTYELVGETWVQGIMNGEVADTLRWEEIQIS